MREAKERIESSECIHELHYFAAYVTPEGRSLCDEYAELIPNPRRFEWNILSSRGIGKYCFDMDGVLCVDPTPEQNDDGKQYEEFIRSTKPLYIPDHKIGWIVTSRLEKYRSQTEEWLERYGVQYGELRMLDLPSKEERIRLKAGASFKAEVYRKTGAELFIESDLKQALPIAEISKKFVYALDTVEMVGPGGLSSLLERTRVSGRKTLRRRLGRLKGALHRCLGR